MTREEAWQRHQDGLGNRTEIEEAAICRAFLTAWHQGRAPVIEAVLLFHSGRPWTPEDQERWEAIVGDPEVTTKVLCDWLRLLESR